MKTAKFVAVDLGATSGRVMLAEVGPGSLEMRQLNRFANDPVYLWNGQRTAMHWDLPGLFANVCAGLAEAGRAGSDVTSVGVDSWAVDYGLLRGGKLLGLPYNYRDARCVTGADAVHATLSQEQIFARNGLQFLNFNTMFQLAADKREGLLDLADAALLIPDLIGYWLTGRMSTERTNASTTGLLGIDGRWDDELETRLGLPGGLFPALAEPGTELGPVLPDLADRVGLSAGLPVTTVASHDTASAVVAIPMHSASAAYISCGTWALVGVELNAPVVSADAAHRQFHQRSGRRRSNSIPAQRDGTVASQRVGAALGARRLPHRSAEPVGAGRRLPGAHRGVRRGRSPLRRARRHAPPHRGLVRRTRPACACESARDGAGHRREPRCRLRPRCRAGHGTLECSGRDGSPGWRRHQEQASLSIGRRSRRRASGRRPGRGDRNR